MMDQRTRATLGCSMMLFTPILLTGVGVLANTSRDQTTSVDVFWTYALGVISVLVFPLGALLWWSNR